MSNIREGDFSWQNANFAAKALLSGTMFLTRSEEQTDRGNRI